jgi:hypothetical protein
VSREPGLHDELVLVDQSQLCQRLRKHYASHEKSLTRLLLELLHALPQVPAHELRVPVDSIQGVRHDVFFCRIDGSGERFHPLRHPIRSRAGRHRTPPRFHQLVRHSTKEEGIGPLDMLRRVTMKVFVGDDRPVVAAPVQCDIDGIAE